MTFVIAGDDDDFDIYSNRGDEQIRKMNQDRNSQKSSKISFIESFLETLSKFAL